MTADDHLSPAQFGFKPISHDEWDAAVVPTFGQEGVRGRLRLDSDLHTAQDYLSKSGVERYVGMKRPDADHPVDIIHSGGKQYITDGHHRVAAARIKGQKTIRVTHYGLDS